MSRSTLALTVPTPGQHQCELEAELVHPDSVDDAHGIVSRAVAVIALVADDVRDDRIMQILGHVEALRGYLLRLLGVSAPVPTKSLASGPTVNAPAHNPDRFLRVDEVMDKTALGRTTIWRMERDGDFPPRRQVGANSVAWLESEVERWMAERPIPEAEEE